MPPKNQVKRPQHVVDEAVKKHLAGGPGSDVVTLAKQYKISRPGFYLWLKHYKEELVAASDKQGLSPTQIDKLDKQTILAERDALKLENQKLRNKVVSLMIKAGDL